MFNKIHSLSIRHKLTLLMLAISVITLIVSSILISRNHFKILEQSVIDKAQTQASLIGASVESAILFDDDSAAKDTLQLLKKDQAIEFASILLPDKKTFAEYYRDTNIAKPTFNIEEPIKLGDGHLDIYQEISAQGQISGYILIRSDLNKLNQQRRYYNKILVAVLLFSMGIAYVLSLYLRKIITNPLESMARHAETFSKTRKYENRLEENHGGELGVLAASFNHMLEVLQKRELELEVHGEELQNLVDKRTEQLYHKAHFDALTGLANRSLLIERLNHAIQSAVRKKSKLALLFLDLNRFKIINDSLGHAVGDQLLKAVSGRLRLLARSVDTIARLGGDEFVFLAEEVKVPEDAARIARRIIKSFDEPFQLDEQLLHVSASVGISTFPEDGSDGSQLLKNADTSMYHSKKEGLGKYCFYNREMNKTSFERLELENQIRYALENNEFHLLYQPQVNVKTDTVTHLEALLRWQSHALGYVPPDAFIPVAEEMGIINQIGIWVISEACRQIKAWSRNGVASVTVAVNVSASHLMSVDLIEHIEKEIRQNEIHYSQLELEITEAVFLDHSDRTLQALKQLQNIGIRIAIDDFGTGYSSLRYLQKFPVDTLKIDGMFIKDLEVNTTSQGIVVSTIALAQGLGLTLVAEGVENKEQLAFLVEKGCDVVQGFYFYKPLPQDEILHLMLEDQKKSS